MGRRLRASALALLLGVILSLSFTPALAQGGTGVAVNLGKIEVDTPLTPGGIYRLPSITVSNTGQRASDYEMEVTYHQDQKELRPDARWVSFEPKTFPLEPGQSQVVAIALYIPAGARPGDYFAYLEAHPVSKETGFAIAIAAATKLHFTLRPANWLEALWARLWTFTELHTPYTYIVPGGAAAIVLILFLSRRFTVRFKLERRDKPR